MKIGQRITVDLDGSPVEGVIVGGQYRDGLAADDEWAAGEKADAWRVRIADLDVEVWALGNGKIVG